jgi:hypothetical protein
MIKRYKINKHNSTVCGYPGRDFDWSKFCWDGSEIHKAIFKGDKNRKALLPFVDDGLIAVNCQYLHVPYNWIKNETIYRVRPNECMYAGGIYRGHKVIKQKAVKENENWYWELELL